MRILFVVTRTDIVGGSQVHVRDLASALVERGHEVDVAAGGTGPFARDLADRDVRFHPLRRLTRKVRPVRDAFALREMRALLRRLRPDLVSLHTAKAGALGRLAARAEGIPALYTPHGWPFAEGVSARRALAYRWIERWLARGGEPLVGVCEAERNLALRHHVGHASQHVVIHNGMPDVPASLRADPGRQPPRLVTVARFEEQKDHATLFSALGPLRGQGWSLDLVGDGSLRPALEAQVRALGLDEHVRFLGARSDVAQFLASAQAFLLISRWEGFPRSILEAMRAGLPIIASDVGGVREAVANDCSGLLVPRGGVSALGQALTRLVANRALRVRYGQEGRRRYEASFRFERMLEDTLALYRTLAPGTEGDIPFDAR